MGKTDIVDAGHFVRKEEIYRKGSIEFVKFGITNLKSIQGRNNKPLKSLKKYVKKKKKHCHKKFSFSSQWNVSFIQCMGMKKK